MIHGLFDECVNVLKGSLTIWRKINQLRLSCILLDSDLNKRVHIMMESRSVSIDTV
jgi:hypothetical protein